MDTCEWVQCIEPPVPEGSNLKTDYNGSNPYEFGDNATYTPSEPDMYFEGNRNQTSFQVRVAKNESDFLSRTLSQSTQLCFTG